ncbi:hypothetical protein BgiMline_022638 [Biomphalaria glabrata]|nr:hypothetical protein BgiMline_010462 [Biomphalaria glabrata]
MTPYLLHFSTHVNLDQNVDHTTIKMYAHNHRAPGPRVTLSSSVYINISWPSGMHPTDQRVSPTFSPPATHMFLIIETSSITFYGRPPPLFSFPFLQFYNLDLNEQEASQYSRRIYGSVQQTDAGSQLRLEYRLEYRLYSFSFQNVFHSEHSRHKFLLSAYTVTSRT